MVRISKMKYYNIYSDECGHYIVHNTNKPFSEGHTHINNYETARYVAYLSLYKKLPKDHRLSIYLIDSVIRISTDEKYIHRMKDFRKEMIVRKEKRKK